MDFGGAYALGDCCHAREDPERSWPLFFYRLVVDARRYRWQRIWSCSLSLVPRTHRRKDEEAFSLRRMIYSLNKKRPNQAIQRNVSAWSVLFISTCKFGVADL